MHRSVRLAVLFLCSLFLLAFQGSAKAQDVLIPAGTLLHCTLDEPNLSSATVAVGDPVICHMRSIQEFGHVVFPRGTYLGGHVEAEKEPGHFVGKGYLKLQFDRIGLPTSDLPVPSKIIAAKGLKVDKDGDIKGHGHATRDIVEWMFPPLWPWKLIMLPARGPRPTLKGEEQVTLRLMDDVMVPRNLAATDYYPNRPPSNYARTQPSSLNSLVVPDAIRPVPRATSIPQQVASTQVATSPASAALPSPATFVSPTATTPPGDDATAHVTMIALKSGEIQAVRSYRIDNGVLNYVLPNGRGGSVYVAEIDWPTTTRLTGEHKTINGAEQTAQISGALN